MYNIQTKDHISPLVKDDHLEFSPNKDPAHLY